MTAYDRQGKPIGQEEWSRLSKDPTYRRVASTKLPNGYVVSTVWLGLDYSFGSGTPLFFETMVFRKKIGGHDYDCERYSSQDEARVGHALMVAKWVKKPKSTRSKQ